MITLTITIVAFIGGVYVGARWGEKLRDIWYSIASK